MNKETIVKDYEETIEKEFELSMLLSNFDNNTEFSHSSSHISYNLLLLLQQNLDQKLKILEMIALNEKLYEIAEIERKHFDKMTSTSGD